MSSVNFNTYISHYNAVKEYRDVYSVDLPLEFNSVAVGKAAEAKALADRVTQIQSADKGVYKFGRALRATALVALGAVGLITVVPALAYLVTVLILDRDPLNLSYRISLKPKEQLKVEEEWDQMRKDWKQTPLENPYNLTGRVSPSEKAPTATAENCRVTMRQLNALFSSSLDHVAQLSDSVVANVNPPTDLYARTVKVIFPR